MADKRDYYEVLGVNRNASDSELKKAFYKLVKENHPDLHQGDKQCEERMKEINEAYEVLSDKEKRAKYDQFGFAGVDPNYGAGSPGGGFSGFGDFDLSDILANAFGGFGGFGGSSSRSKNAPVKGASIRVNLNIKFEEAVFGCEKEIKITRQETCGECGGNGCEKGTTPEVCPQCHGSGMVMSQTSTMFGTMSSSRPCPKCRGEGKIIHQPCKNCGGSGIEKRQKTVKVSIPAGADEGQTFVLSGEGHCGKNGGPNGDLLVTLTVRKHEYFVRDGNNILYELPISVTQAILGAEIEVPTADGETNLSIPAGTQPGDRFTLRGKGVPYIRSKRRGDEIVTVKVVIPKELTIEQRGLVKKLDETMDDSGRAKKSRKKFL